MNQRKLKLISSFAALALVFAVLAVGVWAAATQTVNITTTVKFTATGVSGTISGTLTGLDDTTYYYNSTNASGGEAITFNPKSDALVDWTLGDTTALDVDVTDGVPSSLVYTFTITNASTSNVMNGSITALTAGTNLTLTSITQDTTALTATTGTYALSSIAASGSTTLVLTFDVDDIGSSIDNANIAFTLNLTGPVVA